jgi:hypothetical protein
MGATAKGQAMEMKGLRRVKYWGGIEGGFAVGCRAWSCGSASMVFVMAYLSSLARYPWRSSEARQMDQSDQFSSSGQVVGGR